MTQERTLECTREGCVWKGVAVEAHAGTHLVRDLAERMDARLGPLEGLAAQVAALPAQIEDSVRAMAAGIQPRHDSAEAMLEHAGTCPNCQSILDGYAAHVAEQAPAKAPEPAPAPAPAPVAPEPRPWRIPEGDVDYLALDAYGLVAEQGDNGEAVLRVRDASLWDEALAAQIVPAGCVLKVGTDGKTQYVCEVPRG